MPVACTFDSLYVMPGEMVNGGGSITVTLYKNSVPTVLSVTTSAGSAALGSPAGQLVEAVAGDLIALQASGTGLSTGSSAIKSSLHCR
jgi:hypothetical protein